MPGRPCTEHLTGDRPMTRFATQDPQVTGAIIDEKASNATSDNGGSAGTMTMPGIQARGDEGRDEDLDLDDSAELGGLSDEDLAAVHADGVSSQPRIDPNAASRSDDDVK